MNLLKKIKEEKWLFIIFLLTLIFRLYFTFQTPHFSSENAYLHIFQIQNILETGFHKTLYPPIYPYFITILSFIPLALKIIPEILLSSIVIISFLIAKEITSNKKAALLTALLTAFIPVYITQTLNQLSIYSLIIPLSFLMFYSLIKIKEKKYLIYFILFSFILPLTHPTAILITVSFIFYMILLNIESIKLDKLRKESILFFIFLTLLINLIIYKNEFLSLGINIIYQNIPSQILTNYFKDINVLDAINQLSAIPLIFGISGILFGTIKRKNHHIFLLSGLILTIFILLLFRLIEFSPALIFLGISLAIISSLSFENFFKFISKTKIAPKENLVYFILIILIISTLIIPSFLLSNKLISNSISQEEIEALTWIDENTIANSIVLASPQEGHLISAIAKRRSIINILYIGVPKITERFEDTNRLFATQSETKALALSKKYNIKYIYLSERAKNRYKIGELVYIKNEECYKEIYTNKKTNVYEFTC